MKKKIKAQFGIEFTILVAFMFFVLLGFVAVISNKISESREANRQLIAQDIATLAHNEIQLALQSPNGYNRFFNIPPLIEGLDYTISLVKNREIVVKYSDKEVVIFLPDNVIGNMSTGLNKIWKSQGIVFLQNLTAATECSDNIDNDGDGAIDMNDTACITPKHNDESNCGDGVCEGFENFFWCSLDCSVPDFFWMGSGGKVITFKENGDVILRGTLTQGTVPVETPDDEFVFKDSFGNNLAIINLITGDMTILLSLFENQGFPLIPPVGDNFIISNSSGDIVSYIGETGNWFMLGFLTENGIP